MWWKSKTIQELGMGFLFGTSEGFDPKESRKAVGRWRLNIQTKNHFIFSLFYGRERERCHNGSKHHNDLEKGASGWP